MDIMDRIQLLPQELQDDIFQYTLLADLPYGERKEYGESWTVYHMVKVTYTRPVPRTKTTISCLVSYMQEILQANYSLGLEYAQATLCVARLFVIFDLFKHIPDRFFRPHLKCHRQHNGILQGLGSLRIRMLIIQCCNARGSSPSFDSRCHYTDCSCFQQDIEYYTELCSEPIPDFLLQTVNPLLYGPDEDLPSQFGWNVEDAYFEVNDGEVQALFIWEERRVPYTWLSRIGGPWVLTETAATVKAYDEDGRGGAIEWTLEEDHYELEFSNIWSFNYNIDAYLCRFDKEGIRQANQARNDADYAKQEKKERRRGKTVAAMSKTERAGRTAREGRFWCLG